MKDVDQEEKIILGCSPRQNHQISNNPLFRITTKDIVQIKINKKDNLSGRPFVHARTLTNTNGVQIYVKTPFILHPAKNFYACAFDKLNM